MFGKKTTSGISKANISQGAVAPLETSESASQLFSRQEHEAMQARMHQTPEIFFSDAKLQTADFLNARQQLTEALLDRADFSSMHLLGEEAKRARIREACDELIAHTITTPLTAAQMALLKDQAIDDLLGFGPIEVLMKDPDVSDIMINGHRQVFIEKNGKIALTDVAFGSEKHLLGVIQKIVAIVGRRVDEASPMVDARMPDGSRFNAIIPPLALDGCLVSIRKFKKQKMSLRRYVETGSMSAAMCDFLALCGQIRLNIIVSGGTGSGKTTLLNALSGNIDAGERIVTIEDAAELQLQQPHVLRMETRAPNMEGVGEITQRQLVRNALRMRPDRIILGEIRGDEVVDMLSAMNTGHDGSMTSVHANTPRDAIGRIESLLGMSAISLSPASLRQQIASALHLVVQIARHRDGMRRITQIDEVAGMDGNNVMMRTLFSYRPGAMGADGKLTGTFGCTGAKPEFLKQAAYFGKEDDMLACLQEVAT